MVHDRCTSKRRALLRSALLAALLLLILGAGTVSALDWETTYLGGANHHGGTILALGGADNPGILSMTGDLSYLERTGTDWERTVVGPYTSVTDLALNSAGIPGILVDTGTNHDPYVTCVVRTGGVWQERMVEAETYGGSIAIDSAGNPCVSYVLFGGLMYARWTGTAWQKQTVGDAAGFAPSLALDSAGNPRISYYGYGETKDLMYAAWTGTEWEITTVDTVGAYERPPVLTLDSAGNPWIGYYEGRELKCAVYDAGSWTITTVQLPAEVTISDASVQWDGSGNPRVAYVDQLGNLQYAAWTGSAWQSETVLDTEDSIESPSLALDSAGIPRISCHDIGTGSVIYLEASPGLPLPRLITKVHALGIRPGIETGLTDKLEVAAAALDEGNTRMAVNNLNAFIRLAKAQRGKALTQVQADALIAEAQDLIASM